MNNQSLVWGIFLLLFSYPLGAAEIPAESKIAKVVVYDDRALVTRTASLELAAGKQEIIFSGLPGALEQDSISAKGEGVAKVKLFGARVLTKELEEAQSPRVKELLNELEALRDKENRFNSSETVLNEKWGFLSSIRAAQSEQIGKEIITRQPAADETQKLSLFLDQEFEAVLQKREQLALDRRELAKEIDRVQRELGQIQFGDVKRQVTIAVDLEAETAGRLDLEVSYRVPGASWQPVYEARTDLESGQVQLTLSGMIRQTTGEDWKNAALELSTAKPALGGTMPEIQPWYLYKYEPSTPELYENEGAVKVKSKTRRDAVLMRAEVKAMADRELSQLAEVPALVPAETVQAAIDSKGPSVQYVLSKPETILSDGQPKKSAIQTFGFPANFVHQAVPKLSPYAYLRAKVKNTSEGLLLPGEVQIFLRGAYIGNSWIKAVGTDEEFDLFLGVNEKIRVTQKLLSRKESVSLIPGLKGKTKTIESTYLTTLENYEGKEAAVLFLDHVPMPQHADIKMEFNAEPGSTRSFDDKPGVFEWAFKIPPAGKQKVKLYFKVSHPEAMTVQGL